MNFFLVVEPYIKNAQRYSGLSNEGAQELRKWSLLMGYYKPKNFKFRVDINEGYNNYSITGIIKGKKYIIFYNKFKQYALGNFIEFYNKNTSATKKKLHKANIDPIVRGYKYEDETPKYLKIASLVTIIIIIGIVGLFIGFLLPWAVALYFGGMTASFLWNTYWYRKQSSWKYIILSPFLSWSYFIL